MGNVPGPLLGFGSDGPAAPAGRKCFGRIIVQIDHGRALRSQRRRTNDLFDGLDPLAGPLLADVATGQAVLYYADAAHPTHNTRCTRAWCQTGKERALLTVSGRERVNLNAALNAHAPTQVHLDETGRVDAQSTRRLYEKLLAAHPDTLRIYVVCDNAR